MRRFIALAASVFLVFALAGCGDDAPSPSEKADSKQVLQDMSKKMMMKKAPSKGASDVKKGH